LTRNKCIKHLKQDIRPDWLEPSCFRKKAASGSTIHVGWRDRTLTSSFVFSFFCSLANSLPSRLDCWCRICSSTVQQSCSIIAKKLMRLYGFYKIVIVWKIRDGKILGVRKISKNQKKFNQTPFTSAALTRLVAVATTVHL
jgi:hypothetical protein